jgi:hypothetical protein
MLSRGPVYCWSYSSTVWLHVSRHNILLHLFDISSTKSSSYAARARTRTCNYTVVFREVLGSDYLTRWCDIEATQQQNGSKYELVSFAGIRTTRAQEALHHTDQLSLSNIRTSVRTHATHGNERNYDAVCAFNFHYATRKYLPLDSKQDRLSIAMPPNFTKAAETTSQMIACVSRCTYQWVERAYSFDKRDCELRLPGKTTSNCSSDNPATPIPRCN